MTTTPELAELEREYWEVPAFAQKPILAEINRVRAAAGLPAVDTRLRPAGAAPTPRPAKPRADHSRARSLYDEYRRVKPALDACREYAERVARATSGPGMTPVEPLATAGPGGGPLRCDVCGKPMVLEGGRFHGRYADEAWAAGGHAGWRSYIKGGMVVAVVPNGTLRVYHGYPGNAEHCCEKDRGAGEWTPDLTGFAGLVRFLESEFPAMSDRERDATANDVVNTLACVAAGLGVNRPEGMQ